jgi:hypothetical protein
MRKEEELAYILKCFEESILEKFGKEIPMAEFKEAFQQERAKRLRAFVENKLGHLKDNDFIRLADMAIKPPALPEAAERGRQKKS